MENYQVSARKYRPSKFEEVVGQRHVTATLSNAIQANKLAQAFLFCGPRGVGKTTCARILAKAINAPDPAKAVQDGSYADIDLDIALNIFELDAASNNSVEDIRNLIEQVRFAPQAGKYKVYIIDEVHMLSQSAFNAFLKTLEEPPPYAIFILATTEKHKILPTILSRCQVFNFKRIGVKDIVAHLEEICKQENITAESEALHLMAEKADGALRDALSIFDRIASFSKGEIKYVAVLEALNVLDYDYYFKIMDALLMGDHVKVLLFLDEIIAQGFDGGEFLQGLARHFRNLLFAKDKQTTALLETSESVQQRYLQQAETASAAYLLSGLNIVNEYALNHRTVQNKRLQIELAMLKLSKIQLAFDLKNKQVAPVGGTQKKNKLGATNKASEQTTTHAKVEETVSKSQKNELSLTSLPSKEQERHTVEKQQDASKSEEIVSESSQNLINIEKSETKQTNERPKPSLKETAKGKLGLKLGGSLASKGPQLKSLNQLLEIEAEKVEKEEGRRRVVETDLDTALIQKHWNAYKEGFDSNQSKAIFKKYQPILKANVIEVVVSNALEQARVREESTGLVDALVKQFNLLDLELTVSVDKSLAPQDENKVFTPNDKLQELIKKNPAVAELQRRLFLELKY